MKRFKYFICICVVLMCLSLLLCACGGAENKSSGVTPMPEQGADDEQSEGGSDAGATSGGSVLIAYFSCTNNTEGIAKRIETKTGATLYEIVPQEPYTEEDLRYYTDCRADREQADPQARPAISGSVEKMEKYKVIFLGYPIWHGKAPKIIYTFLESYDFSGKTIIPFCTSGSSPIGDSATNLHALAQGANWLAGVRFDAGASQNAVSEWVDTLGIDMSDKTQVEEMTNEIFLTIEDRKIAVKLEQNAATKALVERLKQGDIEYTARDYGGFEKVGSLGFDLPQSDSNMSAAAGDVMLYLGDQIVLFYGGNTWSYTGLGKMQGVSAAEIREILTQSETVKVKISLH